MTDEIDLDEFGGEEEKDETAADAGDPIWESDDSGADLAPSGSAAESPATETGSNGAAASDADTDEAAVNDTNTDEAVASGTSVGQSAGSAESDPSETRLPHVPYADSGKPAGIPTASGGSGGGAGVDRGESGRSAADAPANGAPEDTSEARGPHGETADDLTLAFTYEAVTRLADPAYVVSDANAWADWVGIVGDVSTPAINKFQREHGVDADFFGGSGTGPRARLQDIDEHSMFHAERFVLVGCADADEADWAPEGWEFVPLSVAAEEAGWSLR